MAAMDFPSSPTDGQVYGNYVYSTATGAWLANPQPQNVAVSSPTAPSSPTTNTLWYNTQDGNTYIYYYDGNTYQWVQLKSDSTLSSTLGTRVESLEAKPSGLVPIVPTSVTVAGGTATVNSLGEVTLGTGITSISLNGVFNSTYKQYRIVLDLKTSVSGGTSTRFRYRKAGTDVSAGYYGSSFGTYYSGSAIQVENRNNGSDGWAGHYGTDEGICEIDISPLMTSVKYNLTHYSIPIGAAFVGGYSTAISGGVDAFTIYPSSGTLSGGNIKVYGYR